MSPSIQSQDAAKNIIENRRLIDGLRQALDMNYVRLLETAEQEWERHFRGKDPSDACVSVHVSSGDSQRLTPSRAGFLTKQERPLLNGSGRPSLA